MHHEHILSPPPYCGGYFGACAVGGSGLRMTPPDKGLTQWHACPRSLEPFPRGSRAVNGHIYPIHRKKVHHEHVLSLSLLRRLLWGLCGGWFGPKNDTPGSGGDTVACPRSLEPFPRPVNVCACACVCVCVCVCVLILIHFYFLFF